MFDELRNVPKSKDLSKPNPALDAAIEEVKSKYPHMFLQEHELKHRTFYDEPLAGAVRSYVATQSKKPAGKKK